MMRAAISQCQRVLGAAFFLFLFPVLVLAITDDFTIRTPVGEETNPPTAPTNLTATPIATSQINLSWSSSTDDVLLEGYHVYRDNVRIATTTTASYEDTGLAASTTYTYYVTAFDWLFNISASSTEAATTTLAPPPPPPTPTTTDGGTTQGTRIDPFRDMIISIEILPQKDSVTIRYETSEYVRSVIKWGRTTSYELGSLAEKAFTTYHETTIAGLRPGTMYRFTIEGENRLSRYGVMHTGTFTTLPPDDVFPPGNVTNLRAFEDGGDIVLTWTNPRDPDLSKIRVLRNDRFYPSDTADGRVVYEGLGESVRDEEAAREDGWRYYTVFSYDELGNISSGAVVSIYIGEGEVPPETDPTKNEISLTFSDLMFLQEGEILPVSDGNVYINGAKQLSIILPYEKVPEHLKTILVSITDSRDRNKVFKFLLRINKDKTGYVSTLSPLGVSGIFPVEVAVFDFTTSQVGYTKGMLISEILPIHTEPVAVGFLGYLIETLSNSYLWWFILALILLSFTGRRLMHAKW